VYIVYKTTQKTTGAFLQTIHKKTSDDFDGYYGSGKLLTSSIRKHGIEDFEFSILKTFETAETAELAKAYEKKNVNEKFTKSKNTFNIAVGQGGYLMAGLSDEEKKIIRKKATVPDGWALGRGPKWKNKTK